MTFLSFQRQEGTDKGHAIVTALSAAADIKASADVINDIRSLETEQPIVDGSAMLRILPLRDEVADYNAKMLPSTGTVVYKAVDSGEEPYRGQLGNVGLDEILRVAVGTPVMMLHNDKALKLVNGNMGEVVRCTDVALEVRFGEHVHTMTQVTREIKCPVTGDVLAARMAYPLRVAYAATIDKVQALTLTAPYAVDLTSLLKRGHNKEVLRALVLVALSRARHSGLIHLRLPVSSKGKPLTNSQLVTILNQGRSTYRTQIMPRLDAMKIPP